MIKKLFFLASLLGFSLSVSAQKQAGNWYFGVNAGISFAGGTAVAVNGALNTPEGCSSMSSVQGNLMFYTDGITVWNKNHVAMPNGNGLFGNSSSTEAAVIVPNPANGAQFYIFTTDEFGGPNGFCYSIVDTSLQGGLGDVTVKNTFVLGNVTEKLAAVRSPKDNSYWIVVHEWGTNFFYSYHLTINGLSAPLISATGIAHNLNMPQNTYGQLKFSTCGKRLAAAIGYQDTIELFDFNANTGVISNPITLPMGDHVYGLEFSANLKYLYASCYKPGSTLVQFDISVDTAATILASKVILSTTPTTYALQMAPDDKIYVTKSYNQFLGVINSPDLPGLSCNYVDQGFDLDPNQMGYMAAVGLPTFMQSYFNGHIPCIAADEVEEVEKNEENVLFPNPSEGHFYIHTGTGKTGIEIYDLLGNLVFSEQGIGTEKEHKVELHAAKGIYVAKVSNGTTQAVQRIVVQ